MCNRHGLLSTVGRGSTGSVAFSRTPLDRGERGRERERVDYCHLCYAQWITIHKWIVNQSAQGHDKPLYKYMCSIPS